MKICWLEINKIIYIINLYERERSFRSQWNMRVSEAKKWARFMMTALFESRRRSFGTTKWKCKRVQIYWGEGELVKYYQFFPFYPSLQHYSCPIPYLVLSIYERYIANTTNEIFSCFSLRLSYHRKFYLPFILLISFLFIGNILQ